MLRKRDYMMHVGNNINLEGMIISNNPSEISDLIKNYINIENKLLKKII